MKPIHEAIIMENACSECRCQTHASTHLFSCDKADLGIFDEPCSKEDWEKCSFYKPPIPIMK